MQKKWTRERIIRQILECEAKGLPLTVGEPGISHALYQAGTRIFGSWRNAIQAAGIPPERGVHGEKGPPARILTIIRNLARRHRPLSAKQLEHRYGSMLPAARRLFGSWSKAVLAAGVDPTKLRRVVPWTRERVIEAILIAHCNFDRWPRPSRAAWNRAMRCMRSDMSRNPSTWLNNRCWAT